IAKLRQVLRREHAASSTLIIKSVTRLSVLEVDESQRGRPVRKMRIARASPAFVKHPHDLLAEQVGGKAGKEFDGSAKPAERDGGVEDGTARVWREGRLSGCRVARQHVDEGFATAQDHVGLRSSG